MHNQTFAEAKQRFLVPDVWRLCGLPGEPRKSCHCPFHRDLQASFSIFDDGLRWKCFAGCGGGDAVDFLQRARGLSQRDACKEFLKLAGGGLIPAQPWSRRLSSGQRPARKVELPDLTPGDETQRQALASLRNVSLEAVAIAAQRGLLVFGEWAERAAWIVTDSTKRNAQARRSDGKPWAEIGDKKAWTLRGSRASSPVGVNEAQPFRCLAFCEGGPDLLAAFHFIHCENRETDCSAVAMLGASFDICAAALPMFAGKRVRIFGHDDASGAGRDAVERWAAQLICSGADVDAFNFAGLRKVDGSPVKDLNDCTSICADDFEANRELWGMLP